MCILNYNWWPTHPLQCPKNIFLITGIYFHIYTPCILLHSVTLTKYSVGHLKATQQPRKVNLQSVLQRKVIEGYWPIISRYENQSFSVPACLRLDVHSFFVMLEIVIVDASVLTTSQNLGSLCKDFICQQCRHDAMHLGDDESSSAEEEHKCLWLETARRKSLIS